MAPNGGNVLAEDCQGRDLAVFTSSPLIHATFVEGEFSRVELPLYGVLGSSQRMFQTSLIWVMRLVADAC